jgi:hypothetical protein
MVKSKTRTTKQRVPENPSIPSAADQVKKEFENYRSTVKAILDDYLVPNDCFFEIETAAGNLHTEMDYIVEDLQQEAEPDLEKTMKDIKYFTDEVTSDQASELLDIVETADESLIYDYTTEKGYGLVKIENNAQRDKLEEFITAEIWPDYNDHDNYHL